jgi:uncharacterized membrane protein
MVELPVPDMKEEDTRLSSAAVASASVQVAQPQLKNVAPSASVGAGSAVSLALGIAGLFLSGPVGALVGAAIGGAAGKLVVGAVRSMEQKVHVQRRGEGSNVRS